MPYKDAAARIEAGKRYRLLNAARIAETKKKRYEAKKDEILAKNRSYRKANAASIAAQRADYRAENAANIREQSKIDYIKRIDHIKLTQAAWRRNLRVEVLLAYGGLQCSCCPEDRLGALVIDHIGGGGNHQRHLLNLAGNTLYRWLKANSFPDGYQTLCANCNQRKIVAGPHSVNKRAVESFQYYHRLKAEAISLFGGHCADCETTDLVILSLHHKNLDGGCHRKAVGHTQGVYLAIIKGRYPIDNLECLCFSCHAVRHAK